MGAVKAWVSLVGLEVREEFGGSRGSSGLMVGLQVAAEGSGTGEGKAWMSLVGLEVRGRWRRREAGNNSNSGTRR